MKRLVVLLLLALGCLALPSRAEVELSFDFFHDELSPMGDWAEVDGYGYVWHPSGVDEDWSPYSDGYWSYTDAGWTWVSYEDWGGITYHYGRWTRVNDFGWCWVPGYQWGPAWVSWRKNDDYVGWAPLPPECDWNEDRGVGVWVDSTYEIGPSYYSFCHTRDFGAPVIRAVLLPRIRNVDICFGTVNITAISYNRDYGCAFNGGFDYDWMRTRCYRPVPALKLVQNTTNIYINGNRGNVFVNSPRGNALVVAAPRVANRTNYNVATRNVAVKRSFQRTAVTKGWAGLDKDATRDRLLVKMREETKGLNRDNSPARRVRPEELAVVPKTADFKAKPAALTKIPEERRNPAVATQGDPAIDRKDRDSRPNRLDRDGDGRPDVTRGGSTEGDGVLPPGRGNGRGKPGEKPAAADEKPVATTEKDPAGGLRRRPGREAAQPEADAPDKTPGAVRQPQPGGAPVVEQPGNDANKAGRRVNPRAADAAVDNDAVEKARATQQERAGQNEKRAAEMKRNAQENAAQENAERAARRERANEMQRENAQEKAGQQNAQRNQAQREAAQENARREATQQQQENQRRMIQERQENNQRQENVQRQRPAAAQEQQAEAHARAAAANRERAVDAQRQQAVEVNRARVMENQQRAAQAQAQQRAAVQEQRAAQNQGQQRAQPQQQQPQQQRQQGGQQGGNGNGKGKGKKGEEQ